MVAAAGWVVVLTLVIAAVIVLVRSLDHLGE